MLFLGEDEEDENVDPERGDNSWCCGEWRGVDCPCMCGEWGRGIGWGWRKAMGLGVEEPLRRGDEDDVVASGTFAICCGSMRACSDL